MSENTKDDATSVESGNKKPNRMSKGFFKSKKFPAFAGLVVLLAIAVVAVVMLAVDVQKDKTLQNIVIGDTTITPEDVSNYAQTLRDNISNSGGAYDESEDTIALNDLVLNAALKKEAKDAGVTVSDEYIVKQSRESLPEGEETSKAVDEFRSLDKTKIVNAENYAYKKALDDKLIIKQSLLIVQSNFDTPYHKSVPEDKIPTLYDNVLSRLNNEFLPMLRGGESADDIAKKVDVNFIKPNKTDDELIKLYGSQAVVAIQRIDEYAPGTQVFNDLEETGYIVGDVGELKNTDEKLRELKNIGDTTDVFASKSGLHMVARLDSANDGKYSSYEDMLNSYIDQYVKYAGVVMQNYVASVNDITKKVADKAILTLTDPALKKANAQGYQCSAHTVRYQVATWVLPAGSDRGGQPGSANVNPRIQFSPQPGGCVNNSDVQDGWLARGETAFADCMQAEPNWGRLDNYQPDPSRFKYKGAYVDRGGGGPWSNGAYNWYRGGDSGPIWDVANANATSNYTNYIWFVYEEVPPDPPPPDPPGGRVVLKINNLTDANCTIFAAAYFRPQGTTGAQDQRVSVRFSGAIDYPAGGSYAGANTWRDDPSNFRNIIFPPPDPATLFPNGSGRNITIWGRITYQGATFQANVSQWVVPPQPFGCNPPAPNQAESSISGSCTSFNMFARDRDGTAGYTLRVYQVGAGAGPVYEESGAVPSSGLSRSINNLNFPVSPGNNNGYFFELIVYDVDIFGQPTGSNSRSTFTTPPCFTASANCVASISPTLPGVNNAVDADNEFTVNVSINQTGQRQVPASNLAIAIRDSSGDISYGNNDGGYANGRNNWAFQVGPVSEITSLQFYVDYVGYFPISGVCSTVDLFMPFELEPSANSISLNPDPERPTSVTFDSSVTNIDSTGVGVPNVTAERTIVRSRSGTNTKVTVQSSVVRVPDTPAERAFSDTAPINDRRLGDEYCGYIVVSPAVGWVGPGDRVIDGAPPASVADGPSYCNSDDGTPTVKVVNRPYVRTYGGDVVAGAGFVNEFNECTNHTSGIFAYMRPLSQQNNTDRLGGSGSQLGVFATGADVLGFTSASMRSSAPSSVGGNNLTFSNEGIPASPSGISPKLGGQLDGNSLCLPDYFTKTQYPEGDVKSVDNSINNLNLATRANNEQTLIEHDVTISGVNNYNKRHTVYVDGDVTITGNIIYSNGTYSKANVAQIPNFTLVVKGDIYVDRTVTRLDGTYIAQPSGASDSGRIYTCSVGDTVQINNPTWLYNNCGASGGVSQLKVFGSFTADKVVLNRTLGTIRDSVYRESYTASSQAAEVFVFSPDVYLSPPVFRPKNSPTNGVYEYISTLPPIL